MARVVRPWPSNPLVMRESSIVVAERPTLMPPYQPVSCASASVLVRLDRAARAAIPIDAGVLMFFMGFSVRGAGTLTTVLTATPMGSWPEQQL